MCSASTLSAELSSELKGDASSAGGSPEVQSSINGTFGKFLARPLLRAKLVELCEWCEVVPVLTSVEWYGG